MKSLSLTVEIVEEAGAWPDRPALGARAKTAIRAAADAAGIALAAGAEVAVVFTDDRHMRGLNRRYRGKDAPTNVLSFPAMPPVDDRFGPLLGDIFVGLETVRDEAERQGLALADHTTHLIVHGFLHLVGYDHTDEANAEVMESLETAILATLGVADPYGTADPADNRRR